jgi:adenine C2-methylase RlmN of 23S rRNA A2503 and tRNA A37
MGFEAPLKVAIDEFLAVLRGAEFGIFSTVRQEKGQDIAGACGQLVIQTSGDKLRPAGLAECSRGMRDIEELAG